MIRAWTEIENNREGSFTDSYRSLPHRPYKPAWIAKPLRKSKKKISSMPLVRFAASDYCSCDPDVRLQTGNFSLLPAFAFCQARDSEGGALISEDVTVRAAPLRRFYQWREHKF